MNIKYIVLILLFLVRFFSLQAQEIKYTGKVVDSLQQPLVYANILAIPNSDKGELSFAITNNKGEFKLKLYKDNTYKITTSFLGYVADSFTISAKENFSKSITLKEDTTALDEVVLNYDIPLEIKKDTITYNADSFVTGEERKLQDILKKLPGVEVGKNGLVTVNGKKITKVLVEGKTFFTGNSKLAVTNIPADAVDKIEVLNNYNEVAMLKDLEDSDDMAMNIKLKEDKKKFVFGDIEVGTGVKERYKIHPSLFYYSPKTNVNFIADASNNGIKSFTVNDYLGFEGGMGRMLKDPSAYFDLYNTDIVKYLENEDFYASKDQFGALNVRRSINEKLDVSTYAIATKTNVLFATDTQNNYINTAIPFIEDRIERSDANLFFGIGKIGLNYKPNTATDIKLSSFFKTFKASTNSVIETVYLAENNMLSNVNKGDNLTFKNGLNINRKVSEKHVISSEVIQDYKEGSPIRNWSTNQEILQGIVPLIPDNEIVINQDKRIKKSKLNAIVKDYWKITNKHYLYTSIGFNFNDEKIVSNEYQQLTNGLINDFSSNNFGNDIHYQLSNPYLKLEYKTSIGITTFTPSLSYHIYKRKINQTLGDEANIKVFFQPKLTAKTIFSSSQKISYKYELATKFPSIENLATRNTLTNFNSAFIGNDTLENTLYHNFSVRYYRFSSYRKMNITAFFSYREKERSLKKQATLEGIESLNTIFMFNQPEHNWRFNAGVSKRIKKIKYFFKSELNYNIYYQILNAITNKNKVANNKLIVGATTYFKNIPNIAVNFSKRYSKFQTEQQTTKYVNNELLVDLEYDFWNGFIFKSDYSFIQNVNKNTQIINNYNQAKLSLFYQKENCAWGYELAINNLFNQKYKQNNSFSNYLISEEFTTVMPRVIMFKLSYKL